MKRLVFFTLTFLLLLLSVNIASAQLDSLLGGLPGIPDFTPPPADAGYDWFYTRSVMMATWALGWIRNLFPKFKGSGIPRVIQVSIVGLAAGMFILWLRPSNVNWSQLLASVFSTQIIYDSVKGGIKQLEQRHPVPAAILSLLFRGLQKTPGVKVQIIPSQIKAGIIMIPLALSTTILQGQSDYKIVKDKEIIQAPVTGELMTVEYTILRTKKATDIYYGIPRWTTRHGHTQRDFSDLVDLTPEKDLPGSVEVILLACNMHEEYTPVAFRHKGLGHYIGVYIRSEDLEHVRGSLGRRLTATEERQL